MKKIYCVFLMSILVSVSSHAYIWSSAVPSEVRLFPNGLVLMGDFSNEGVACATGPKAIFLPSTDPDFDRKVSMALVAFTAGKTITVLINDPLATNCVQVSALGFIPVAFDHYWQLK